MLHPKRKLQLRESTKKKKGLLSHLFFFYSWSNQLLKKKAEKILRVNEIVICMYLNYVFLPKKALIYLISVLMTNYQKKNKWKLLWFI